jgi:hypothetical protein
MSVHKKTIKTRRKEDDLLEVHAGCTRQLPSPSLEIAAENGRADLAFSLLFIGFYSRCEMIANIGEIFLDMFLAFGYHYLHTIGWLI